MVGRRVWGISGIRALLDLCAISVVLIESWTGGMLEIYDEDGVAACCLSSLASIFPCIICAAYTYTFSTAAICLVGLDKNLNQKSYHVSFPI